MVSGGVNADTSSLLEAEDNVRSLLVIPVYGGRARSGTRVLRKKHPWLVSFGPVWWLFISPYPTPVVGGGGCLTLDEKRPHRSLGLKKSGRRSLHTWSGNRVLACSTLRRAQ